MCVCIYIYIYIYTYIYISIPHICDITCIYNTCAVQTHVPSCIGALMGILMTCIQPLGSVSAITDFCRCTQHTHPLDVPEQRHRLWRSGLQLRQGWGKSTIYFAGSPQFILLAVVLGKCAEGPATVPSSRAGEILEEYLSDSNADAVEEGSYSMSLFACCMNLNEWEEPRR